MQPLLKVEHLTKLYSRKHFRGPQLAVQALDDISFAIFPGTTFAVVGASGSGKTSLALCVGCLERPTSGSVWLNGREVTLLTETERRAIRPQVQIVFQDPVSSLNPQWNVGEILVEPLTIQRRFTPVECKNRATALLERVGLPADLASRKARELSGGQRQRLAIARALTLEPKLLILDEALSALDCSVQAHIANLLMELQASMGLTYLFITHDLAMAAHLADEIAVMHGGRIAEQGAAERVLGRPEHEITKTLVAATPRLTSSTCPSPEW
jgi:peptide/nickel transport system ATP-binding protein